MRCWFLMLLLGNGLFIFESFFCVLLLFEFFVFALANSFLRFIGAAARRRFFWIGLGFIWIIFVFVWGVLCGGVWFVGMKWCSCLRVFMVGLGGLGVFVREKCILELEATGASGWVGVGIFIVCVVLLSIWLLCVNFFWCFCIFELKVFCDLLFEEVRFISMMSTSRIASVIFCRGLGGRFELLLFWEDFLFFDCEICWWFFMSVCCFGGGFIGGGKFLLFEFGDGVAVKVFLTRRRFNFVSWCFLVIRWFCCVCLFVVFVFFMCLRLCIWVLLILFCVCCLMLLFVKFRKLSASLVVFKRSASISFSFFLCMILMLLFFVVVLIVFVVGMLLLSGLWLSILMMVFCEYYVLTTRIISVKIVF